MKSLIPIAVLTACVLSACESKQPTVYQGYVEGEYMLVASPDAGSLVTLNVARGQTVASGAPLFTLERGNETAGKQEAEERLRAAKAKLDNMRKGQRAPEVDALEAEAAQADAALKLSEAQFKRNQELFESGFISSAGLDEAKANLERDRARAQQSRAQIRVAKQSVGRSEEMAMAQAEIDAAKAVLAQADWRLGQKAQSAPQGGLVQDTFFVQGEWVPAGRPVVSILPPANLKLRFFVPENVVGQLHIGQAIHATCDGCGVPIPATISYVSPNSEFTPPVIYSKESRAKLVFMIEATSVAAEAMRLKPGQPLDVAL